MGFFPVLSWQPSSLCLLIVGLFSQDCRHFSEAFVWCLVSLRPSGWLGCLWKRPSQDLVVLPVCLLRELDSSPRVTGGGDWGYLDVCNCLGGSVGCRRPSGDPFAEAWDEAESRVSTPSGTTGVLVAVFLGVLCLCLEDVCVSCSIPCLAGSSQLNSDCLLDDERDCGLALGWSVVEMSF